MYNVKMRQQNVNVLFKSLMLRCRWSMKQMKLKKWKSTQDVCQRTVDLRELLYLRMISEECMMRGLDTDITQQQCYSRGIVQSSC